MDLVLRSYNVSHRFTDLTGKKLSCFKMAFLSECIFYFTNPTGAEFHHPVIVSINYRLPSHPYPKACLPPFSNRIYLYL